MPSIRVPKTENSAYYFLTFTIKNWYYILDRYNRWNILAKSLIFCQRNKGLAVYSYVFMPNHLHLIISSDDISGFIRDFKKFTSNEIRKNILENEPSILKLFQDTESHSFNLWSSTNMPKMFRTEKFLLQKVKYIHDNPVKRSYVERPEYWYWSSANPNSEIKIDNFVL